MLTSSNWPVGALQVDGFPPPDKLRTVYVEHDIQGSQESYSVSEFVLADPVLAGTSAEEVRLSDDCISVVCQSQLTPRWLAPHRVSMLPLVL